MGHLDRKSVDSAEGGWIGNQGMVVYDGMIGYDLNALAQRGRRQSELQLGGTIFCGFEGEVEKFFRTDPKELRTENEEYFAILRYKKRCSARNEWQVKLKETSAAVLREWAIGGDPFGSHIFPPTLLLGLSPFGTFSPFGARPDLVRISR